MKFFLILGLSLLFSGLQASTRFVRVMFSGDASNSATIGWDQLSGDNVSLKYDTASPSDFQYAFQGEIIKQNTIKGMHTHFVELKNLKANTRYNFIIKDSEGYSKAYHFYTAPNSNKERLSFIGGGDSRSRSAVRRKANVMVAKLKPHAVLFAGDFTAIDIEREWKQWLEDWEYSIGKDGRITPIVVTRGNHELTNKSMVNLFNVPSKRVYYSTQFGGDLYNVITLNSEIFKGGPQAWWLKSDLKEHKDFFWQMPMYHRPIRPHVKHKKEMKTQYKNFLPHFEKMKNVALALECDSHTAKTTWPIISSTEPGAEEGFKRDDANGIVYIGEGCWGAPPRVADDKKCWTRDAEMVDSFKWIFVDQEKIEVRTVLYTNSDVIDELNPENRFDMPDLIELWTPSNGAVVTVTPRI